MLINTYATSNIQSPPGRYNQHGHGHGHNKVSPRWHPSHSKRCHPAVSRQPSNANLDKLHASKVESLGGQERQLLSLQFVKAPLVNPINLACCLLQSTADAKPCRVERVFRSIIACFSKVTIRHRGTSVWVESTRCDRSAETDLLPS